jgi:hypothetical protein
VSVALSPHESARTSRGEQAWGNQAHNGTQASRRNTRTNPGVGDSRGTTAATSLKSTKVTSSDSDAVVELQNFTQLDGLVKSSTKPVLVFFVNKDFLSRDPYGYQTGSNSDGKNVSRLSVVYDHVVSNQKMLEHFNKLRENYGSQIVFATIDTAKFDLNSDTTNDMQRLIALMYPDIDFTKRVRYEKWGRTVSLADYDVSHRFVLFDKGQQVLFKRTSPNTVSLKWQPTWEDEDHRERRSISSQHKSPALMAKMVEVALGKPLSPNPESLYDFN